MQPFDRIREYTDTVCDQVRWKKIRPAIKEEIENHLIDQRDTYIAQGSDEAQATQDAVAGMGDPVTVGTQLDRTHRPRPQWSMLFLTVAILATGLFIRMFLVDERHSDIMSGQLTAAAVGLVFLAAAYLMDFTLIGKYPKTIYFLVLSASVAALKLSPVVNGRSYYAGFITLLFPLGLTAVVYLMRNKGYLGIALCGIAFFAAAGIALFIPSLSGFMLFAVAGLILMSLAIARDWFNVKKLYGYLMIYVPAAGVLLMAAVIMFARGSGLSRLRVAIDPSIDALGTGYMAIVTRTLLGGSKLAGGGVMPAEYASFKFPLPGVETDFILTYLIFRAGWIAFILIMALLLFFIVKGFLLCFKQKSSLGLFVSVTVMLTFTMQVLGYVTANLGFQLFSPIALPLLSYGKIATVINLALIGMMLSVFRTGDAVKDRYANAAQKDSFITWGDGKLIISFGKK